jgi:glycosyltransferase involved in cell wall biosynthesis
MDPIKGRKILFVITKSNWGGAQTYVYTLATQLQKLGADVAVVLGGTGLPGTAAGLLDEKLRASGIRTIFLGSFVREISLIHELKAGLELLSVLRKERPDVLHLNSTKAGGIGSFAGRLANNKNIIYTAHGWAHREPRMFVWRLGAWLGSWATIFFSHKVITVSDLDRKDAPVFFSRNKLTVVHNGIKTFELLSKEEVRAELAKKGVPTKSGRWILMISELIRNKAVDVAVEAFALIKDKFPDANIVVFGEGELRGSLSKLISERGLDGKVLLPGFISDAKAYMQGFDVFLMSSYKEGFPMSLLEAGMARIPVIATQTGGIPELVEDHHTGRLFPPGNFHALASIIEETLSNDSDREQMAHALHERVTKDFSVEKMVSETLRVYS